MKEGETHRRNLKEETQREMERKFKKKKLLCKVTTYYLCVKCVCICVKVRERESHTVICREKERGGEKSNGLEMTLPLLNSEENQSCSELQSCALLLRTFCLLIQKSYFTI